MEEECRFVLLTGGEMKRMWEKTNWLTRQEAQIVVVWKSRRVWWGRCAGERRTV